MPEQVCIAAADGLISFYAVLGDDIRSARRPRVGHGLDPSMDWIGSAKMDPCPTLCRPIQGGFCVFGVINTITVSAQFLGYNTALMCLSVHCL